MTKYFPIGEFLITSGRLEVKLSFMEIEKILGFKLPYSAYTYAAWWANGGHPQAESWLSAGFFTKELDILNGTVLFCKKEAQHHPSRR